MALAMIAKHTVAVVWACVQGGSGPRSSEWFEYRLEHDPRFLQRIARARQSLEAGQGVKLESLAKRRRRRK
jgi:hypothetical protein